MEDHGSTFKKPVTAKSKKQISPALVSSKSKPNGRVSSNVDDEEQAPTHVSQSTRSSKKREESSQQSSVDEASALKSVKNMFEHLVRRHEKKVR